MEKVRELIKNGTIGMSSIITVPISQVPVLVGEWLLCHKPDHKDYEEVALALEYGDLDTMVKFTESWTLNNLEIYVIKGGCQRA